jgi:hypothetical protein
MRRRPASGAGRRKKDRSAKREFREQAQRATVAMRSAYHDRAAQRLKRPHHRPRGTPRRPRK